MNCIKYCQKTPTKYELDNLQVSLWEKDLSYYSANLGLIRDSFSNMGTERNGFYRIMTNAIVGVGM